ncbi:replication initiation and membrane attachment family protein [Bacillus timonensis]|nr:replication initiation and membrane attachment family protein [Bacillus timonensis]
MNQHWKEILPIDRYIVRASSLLHDYDRKILTLLYQPLIGVTSYSLYMTLWSELEQNRLWGEENSHHHIMATMQLNLRDIYKERLKLEGIGLLKTYVKNESDQRSYLYELQPPISPQEFFSDGVLNVYLYNRVGKTKYNHLKRFFSDKEIDTTNYQSVTKTFNEVFDSIKATEMVSQISNEMRADLDSDQNNAFIQRSSSSDYQLKNSFFDFDLFFAGLSEVMIPKKAINNAVKEAILKLSFLYSIDPLQMQNITMSALNHDDTIDIEKLRKSARDWYQFENGDSLPTLIERTQPLPLQTMTNQEPTSKEEQLIKQLEVISPKQLLIDISGGAEPSSGDLKIVEDVLFHQKLQPGVVNVLIYYVMLRTDMKLSKAYVEKIAGHWTRKGIKTVKEAMDLAKQEHRQYQNWAENGKAKSNRRRNPIRTEMLPEWLNQEKKATKEMKEQPSEENLVFELEKKKLEEDLKKYKKKSVNNPK